jgi:hypothetical protein
MQQSRDWLTANSDLRSGESHERPGTSQTNNGPAASMGPTTWFFSETKTRQRAGASEKHPFYGLVPVVGALPGCGTSDQCSQIWVLGFLNSFLCAPLVGEVLSKCDADLLLLAGHGGEVEKQQGECSAEEPFLVGRGDEEEQRSDVPSMPRPWHLQKRDY